MTNDMGVVVPSMSKTIQRCEFIDLEQHNVEMKTAEKSWKFTLAGAMPLLEVPALAVTGVFRRVPITLCEIQIEACNDVVQSNPN